MGPQREEKEKKSLIPVMNRTHSVGGATVICSGEQITVALPTKPARRHPQNPNHKINSKVITISHPLGIRENWNQCSLLSSRLSYIISYNFISFAWRGDKKKVLKFSEIATDSKNLCVFAGGKKPRKQLKQWPQLPEIATNS